MMTCDDRQTLGELYRRTLFDDAIPFWEAHSLDHECGGYFTCVDREGCVYDTDKFVWLQARQVWTFSMLYNRAEKRSAWLETARLGADFLAKHGRDHDGSWYFALNREGAPLVQPYNIFSDCFACMAFSQFSLATGDKDAKAIAQETFESIWRRKENPKGSYNKVVPGTRPMRSFALPMILANLSLELDWLLDADALEAALDICVSEVMGGFLDAQTGLVYEHLAADGSHPDTFDGRLISPGHGIEAMWFIMDIGERRQDQALIERAVATMLRTLDFAWDREYDGIYYFMDAEGKPPQQLEWDQKLWWVHLEALVALLMGHRLTQQSACKHWFDRVHAYAWDHFADPEYGEWFGYLNRQGELLLPLKGGKWKGCFHVPRGLYRCWQELEALSATKGTLPSEDKA